MSVCVTSDLDRLAQEANAEHHAYEATQSVAIAHAIACGQALNSAKDLLPHGEWLPWLREHFDGSRQTADNYRRIAANCQRVSNLGSVRGALAELADPAPPPQTSHNRDEFLENCQKLANLGAAKPSKKTVDEAYELALAENREWAWSRAFAAVETAMKARPPHGNYALVSTYREDLPDALRRLADDIESLPIEAEEPLCGGSVGTSSNALPTRL